MPRKLSIGSWATVTEAATIRLETVPRTVAKAMEEMIAKKHHAEGKSQERGGHMVVHDVDDAVGHGADAHEDREDEEKPGGFGARVPTACEGLRYQAGFRCRSCFLGHPLSRRVCLPRERGKAAKLPVIKHFLISVDFFGTPR